MILDREWRERQLQARMQAWAPRVGTDVVTIYTNGLVRKQVGYVVLVAWVVLSIALGIVLHGAATVAVESAFAVACWPVALCCYWSALRRYKEARVTAAKKLATRDDAGVPLRDVERFDNWLANGKYSKANPRNLGSSP